MKIGGASAFEVSGCAARLLLAKTDAREWAMVVFRFAAYALFWLKVLIKLPSVKHEAQHQTVFFSDRIIESIFTLG